MSIVIFGGGFLGTRLSRELPGAHLSKVDITDAAAVAAELRERKPRAVINAAGKTGHPNVDWCELHPNETMRSNVLGPLVLADACAKAGAYLLHLGSGCIFYGDSPSAGGWREDDFANPISTYSRSKYAADLALSRLPDVAVVRLRMPIDSAPGARNLITKLSKYADVVDVENSVTIVDDLVKVVAALIEKRATGVFHGTNPGTMRHKDLLALYNKHVDPNHSYNLIGEAELVSRGLALKPRSNCILASPRLEELGIRMRPVGEALEDAMKRYAQRAQRERAAAP